MRCILALVWMYMILLMRGSVSDVFEVSNCPCSNVQMSLMYMCPVVDVCAVISHAGSRSLLMLMSLLVM